MKAWQVGVPYRDCQSRSGAQVSLSVQVVQLVAGLVVGVVVGLVVVHFLMASFAAPHLRYRT